jgi:hypothetical protein
VIRDLFGNQLQDPFELVFSTGAEITASAVAGLIWDRITGTGLEDYLVTAMTEDSTVYLARTDTGGIYALRYLVPGTYTLTAFQDRNRNERADSTEVQGSVTQTISGADTLFSDIPVLLPDTSPARLQSVAVLDSGMIALTFDDYLDPSAPASRIVVSLVGPDSTPRPAGRVFQEPEYVAWAAQIQATLARLDSMEEEAAARARALAERDTANASDSARAALERPDSAQTGPPRPPVPPELPGISGGRSISVRRPSGGTGEEGPPTGPDGNPLPGRRLVVQLSVPLEPEVTYLVRTQGVVNVNGVPDGGGEAEAERPAPPPPDTTSVPDSTFVPDTAAVGDTIPPTDTVPPPDTIPPDTGRVFLPGRHR